jgi:hypothetical protein
MRRQILIGCLIGVTAVFASARHTRKPSFEVASVKRSPLGRVGGSLGPTQRVQLGGEGQRTCCSASWLTELVNWDRAFSCLVLRYLFNPVVEVWFSLPS